MEQQNPDDVDVTTENFNAFFANADIRKEFLKLVQHTDTMYDCINAHNLNFVDISYYQEQVIDIARKLTLDYFTSDIDLPPLTRSRPNCFENINNNNNNNGGAIENDPQNPIIGGKRQKSRRRRRHNRRTRRK